MTSLSPAQRPSSDLLTRLEATMTIMHGSAYQPARMALRVLKWLAGEDAYLPEPSTRAELGQLAKTLRRFAPTVPPTAERALDNAATILDAVGAV